MSETEATQRRKGSAADARGAEAVGRETVIEQRTPIAPGLALPEHRRTGALVRLLARGSQDGTEVHAAMEDMQAIVGEYVQREFTPVVAAIEARFDVQDAKIDAQSVKIENLTAAVRDLTAATAATNAKLEGQIAIVGELTKAVAATNAKVERLTAKVAAQNARIGALYWMFGIVIALFMALAAVGVYNYVLPPPNAASGTAGPGRQATSGAPPEPPGEAGGVPPAPTATSREPPLDGGEP